MLSAINKICKAASVASFTGALAACGQSGAPDAGHNDGAHGAEATVKYDVIIRGGHVYDGEGGAPYMADVAIEDDKVAAIGDLSAASGEKEIEATGLAVSPGFIDLVGFSYDFFLADGRALSAVYQGVTLEVFHGEGDSMAPLTQAMKDDMLSRQYQFKYDITWDTMDGYLDAVSQKGTGINYAATVGGNTVWRYVLGEGDQSPSDEELEEMRAAVRKAFDDGAYGFVAGLGWTPGLYYTERELIAAAEVVKEYDGVMMWGLRSESADLIPSLQEALAVARKTGVRMTICHIKQSGEPNWDKIDETLATMNAAREEGLDVTANIYTYTAMWSALSSALPPWAHEGGFDKMIERTQDPDTAQRIVDDLTNWTGGWDQLIALSGTPENVLFLKIQGELSKYQGKTLADVMTDMDMTEEEAAVYMLATSGNEVWTAYNTQSEDNVRKTIAEPWVALGSDANAIAAEGVWLTSFVHPRTYANATRLVGKYARDEGVISVPEAVRRMTSLPADIMGIDRRGRLKEGAFADILVFDIDGMHDNATFSDPHQYSDGMKYVFVNGEAVLENGVHTGALPGRDVRRGR